MRDYDPENEKPIEGYDFSSKKKELEKIFNTPAYEDYYKKKKSIQKRRETAYKITSLGTTTTIRNLIFINTIIFVFTWWLFKSEKTIELFAMFPLNSGYIKIWQPITSMFLHAGFWHLFLNMFFLWQFGDSLEKILGTSRFLKLYIFSGLVSSLFWIFLGTNPAVGASGALCGLLAAYLFAGPNTTVYFMFIIPLKMKYLVYLMFVISLIFGLLSLSNSSSTIFRVGHFAHLGGMIGGFLFTYYWKKKGLFELETYQ